MKIPRKSINNGFTLAEVLITLAIIGVVASISVPSLMQDFEEQKYKTAAKKAFAQISAAVNQMKADEGGTISQYDATINSSVAGTFKPVFMKYFKVIKDCNNEDCVQGATYSNAYSTYNGNPANTNLGGEGQFVTADGMFFNVQNPIGTTIFIVVDVNGYNKKPNKFGVDTFAFKITDNAVIPCGMPDTDYTACSTASTSNTNGLGCTVKVMKDEPY